MHDEAVTHLDDQILQLTGLALPNTRDLQQGEGDSSPQVLGSVCVLWGPGRWGRAHRLSLPG